MKKILGQLGGRKFLATIVAIVLASLLDLSLVQAIALAGTITGYNFAQAYADAKTDGKTSTTVPDDPKAE